MGEKGMMTEINRARMF